MIKKSLYFVVLLLLTISGCDTPENFNCDINNSQMINESKFASLRCKKVYFGHQSVGYDIIDGLNSLAGKNMELGFIKIITFEEYLSFTIPANDSSFYFIHSKIGRNQFPEFKLDDFKNKLDTLQGINAAFLKFCYIDINRNTDVNSLYNKYLDTFLSLKSKHEEITFVYFTSPLTTRGNYFTGLLKTILGRSDHNIKRNRFNKLLRETDNINLFDIAHYESHLEGDLKDLRQEYLLKEYTYDNRHLNKVGAENVALNLLYYLNNLLQEKRSFD